MSVRELLATLAGIQETVLLYPSTGGHRARRMTTETTTSPPPPAWAPLEAALRARRPVRLTYHGHQRLVCPHALGWKAGRAMLLAYQTGGYTTTGTLPTDPQRGWRCPHVDEIDHLIPADPASPWDTADNYNHQRPFPAIDHTTVAIPPNDPPHAS